MTRAADVMTADVTTIREDQSVEHLVHLLRVSHFACLPVLDAEERAVGVISENDVLRAFAFNVGGEGEFSTKLHDRAERKGVTTRLIQALDDIERTAAGLRTLMGRPVRELMNPVVHSCKEDDPVEELCKTMVWKSVHRLIVLRDDGKVCGLVSSLDLVRNLGGV